MNISLIRIEKTDKYTVGKIEIKDVFSCFCIEDAERTDKIHGCTAIPAGRYEVIMNFSNRFQKTMPLLLNVPNFQGIRIHAGNDIDDTEGCLLPNLVYEGKGVGAYSRGATDILTELIKEATDNNEKVFINIIDTPSV